MNVITSALLKCRPSIKARNTRSAKASPRMCRPRCPGCPCRSCPRVVRFQETRQIFKRRASQTSRTRLSELESAITTLNIIKMGETLPDMTLLPPPLFASTVCIRIFTITLCGIKYSTFLTIGIRQLYIILTTGRSCQHPWVFGAFRSYHRIASTTRTRHLPVGMYNAGLLAVRIQMDRASCLWRVQNCWQLVCFLSFWRLKGPTSSLVAY